MGSVKRKTKTNPKTKKKTQTQKWRVLFTVQVPAGPRLWGKRTERRAPSPGGGPSAQELKGIIRGRRQGRGTQPQAGGRGLGERQTDTANPSSLRKKPQAGRKPGCGYVICTLSAPQIFSAPKSSVGRGGPEPRSILVLSSRLFSSLTSSRSLS